MNASLTSKRAGYSIGFLLALVAMWNTIISDNALARRSIPLMIQTIPELPGARFSLNGQEFTADENGLALITVPKPNIYRLKVLSDRSNRSERRRRFAVWSDAKRAPARPIEVKTFTFLAAGFETSRRVAFQFVDRNGAPLDPGRIESITLTDSAGKSMRLMGPGPHHLVARFPISNGTSLRLEESDYRIQDAIIEGQNVLPQDIRLNPSVDTQPLVQLAISTRAAAAESSPEERDTLWWVVVVLLVAAVAVVLAMAKGFHAFAFAKDLVTHLPSWGASELRWLNLRRPDKCRGSPSGSLESADASAQSVRAKGVQDSAEFQTEHELPSGPPLPDLQGLPIAMAEVDRLIEAFAAARRRLSTKDDDHVAENENDGIEAIRLQRELEAEQFRLANLEIERERRNAELQAEYNAKETARRQLERASRASPRRGVFPERESPSED